MVVQYALEASKSIKDKTGKKVRVVDLYSVKPIDRYAVVSAARTGHVIVAQDHNVIGGLGSIVGTILAEEGICTDFVIIGINDEFAPMAHAAFLYKKYGLDKEGLEETMKGMLGIA